MKIKTKKEMNLPELIEWGFGNKVTGSYFAIDGVYAKRIRFQSGVFVGMNGEFNKDDTFKLDIEEEIEVHTNLDALVEVRESGTVHTHYDTSIREEERDSTVEFHTLIEGKLVLIWDREEGLVE